MKGYVIGVATQIEHICKVGDLHFLIRVSATALDLLLNQRGVKRVDFLSTQIETFNVDRKNPSAEWTQGISFAIHDVKSYAKAIQASLKEKAA